ncbi:MAG: hypothetical protein HKUEN07_04070 [Rhodocyclaceae bacterium]|uniref:Helix-turn-helix domain-containing protein n=1 Tax=Candidatus Desulfobacillus denitrificans TaxID=2608985 RepID=A0A809R3N2_9PROT|nr:hypothetical protein DSYM_20270 [Candidatus Desulfobacillus denitrificans]GIK46708.1 MAG: hypothetical protein BroJett012_26110 [Betaproteobacteria bacterium]GJQ53838.1 MAG: hypothetical protein HKUEN07_04070 [Rhodocyclaceae bacterium]
MPPLVRHDEDIIMQTTLQQIIAEAVATALQAAAARGALGPEFTLPSRLNLSQLAEVAGIPYATMRTWLTREPWRLPPRWAPGGRGGKERLRTFFAREDVIDWLKAGREIAAAPSPTPHAATPSHRGAPRKEERIEAERLGITVPELRAQRLVKGRQL